MKLIAAWAFLPAVGILAEVRPEGRFFPDRRRRLHHRNDSQG
jgi:hypothetical protein